MVADVTRGIAEKSCACALADADKMHRVLQDAGRHFADANQNLN